MRRRRATILQPNGSGRTAHANLFLSLNSACTLGPFRITTNFRITMAQSCEPPRRTHHMRQP